MTKIDYINNKKFASRIIMIILPIIILFLNAGKLYSQSDTIASLIIDEPELINYDKLKFQIRLLRHSDYWTSYANGTYQLVFDQQDYFISKDSVAIEFNDKTDLKLYKNLGDNTPIDGYGIDAVIHDSGRISIMVVGPEKYEDAKVVPVDTKGILIGEFVVKMTNGSFIPTKIKWLEPYHLYQACAYKIGQDSLLGGLVLQYKKDSNLELFDSLTTFIEYGTRETKKPEFVLDYFNVEYVGQKIVNINWKTSSEVNSDGFVLLRGMKSSFDQSVDEVQFTDTVSSYLNNPDLRGTGVADAGRMYSIDDEVRYRGVDYCYKLLYHNRISQTDHVDSLLGRKCIAIPNAVIYQASAAPNPFKDQTEIQFWVEDDVYLTAYLRDLNGKEIMKLCENQMFNENMKRNAHVLPMNVPSLAAAGLYDVVLIAVPINDSSITQSTANIKVQLLR